MPAPPTPAPSTSSRSFRASKMIHLINMPFGSIMHPNLALSIIKAQLQAAGLPCIVHNFNLDFAQRIGFGGYESIALFKGVETQVSEWLFTEAVWDQGFGPTEDEFLSLCGEELESLHDLVKIPDKR